MEKKISISSKIENLRLVEKFVDEITSDYKLSNERYGNILIATLEAANNGIVHGNKLNENENIIINAEIKEKFLKITVIDNGKGFNYQNLPDPTSPENIEKINGRGVFLMQKLADAIVFNNNGNTVELTFNLD